MKFRANNRKKQLKFLGPVMRKERLENLIFTGEVEGNRDRRKRRVIYLMSLSKWMLEQSLREITKNY